MSTEQPGKVHKMPTYLSALGWFWDGDPYNTSAKAQCFFLTQSKIIDKLKNIFEVKKIYTL
jgi:hypothetical protein